MTLTSATGVADMLLIDGVVTAVPVKIDGRKASIREALARFDDSPEVKRVILAQGCAKRAVSICTVIASSNFVGLFATDGINLAEILQILGRVTGRGFLGDVVGLLRLADLAAVLLLDEFTALAVRVNIAGRDFMCCPELSDPRFDALLEMVRPFNRKGVLADMPENRAEKRRRVEDARVAAGHGLQLDVPAAAEPPAPGAAATPAATSFLQKLVGWDKMLFVLSRTDCFMADKEMKTADVIRAVPSIMEPLGVRMSDSNHNSAARMKLEGWIEARRGVFKLTAAGRAAAKRLNDKYIALL